MNFKFTKYGFTNALWSLIPIFPIWTLFPGILSAAAIGNLINDCERAYSIVLWTCVVLTIIIIAFFLIRIDKFRVKEEKKVKMNFRLWSLLIYTLTNTIGLIAVIGIYLACHGDGQTLLACIYSGPIASLTLIIFGIFTDVRIKTIVIREQKKSNPT